MQLDRLWRYLINDSLIEIKNVLTGSNNITLWKAHIKPYECDKMYIDKDLIEDWSNNRLIK